MSLLPSFRCLFLSCQQQKNTEKGAAVTSLRSFLFRDDFTRLHIDSYLRDPTTNSEKTNPEFSRIFQCIKIVLNENKTIANI